MIECKISKKESLVHIEIGGVKAFDAADEVGNLVRGITRAVLCKIPADEQKAYCELLKQAIVGGYRVGIKEVLHETAD